MSKLLASSLALGAALVWCQGGFAQQQDRQRDAALFDRLDANKDGVVTADEVSEDRKSFFERLLRTSDKNKDGKLSKEEFTAGEQDQPRRAADQPNNPQRPQSGQGGLDAERLFRFMDKNGDGKVLPDEVAEERREMFKNTLSRGDKDGDGALSLEEFKAVGFGRPGAGTPGAPGATGMPPMPGNSPLFRALDTNGNGKIEADELAKAGDSLKALDRNKDGVLTPDEIGPPGGLAGQPAQPGRPAGAPQGGEAQAFLERIKQADKNGDGKLSKDEAPERLKENFDRLDANGDGFIDQAEVSRLAGRRPQGQPGQGNPQRRRPNQENKENKDIKDNK